MKNERATRALIREASQAHCDLNILYGVMALLEGGTMSGHTHRATSRINKICRDEAQRCLVRMDRAADKIVDPRP